jgi:hypothetical protein
MSAEPNIKSREGAARRAADLLQRLGYNKEAEDVRRIIRSLQQTRGIARQFHAELRTIRHDSGLES